MELPFISSEEVIDIKVREFSLSLVLVNSLLFLNKIGHSLSNIRTKYNGYFNEV